MAESDGQERTEQPTPKRLREARQKGQMARSRELNTMAVLMAGAGGFLMFGPGMIETLTRILRLGLDLDRSHIFDLAVVPLLLREAILEGLLGLVPFFVVVIAAAFLAPMALGGWSFSTQALAFKGEKLNPIKGLKRIFAWRGLVELLKALAKFFLIGGVAVTILYHQAGAFLGLGQETPEQALGHAASLLSWAFLLLCASLIVIALVDVPFQLWDFNRQQKMTRQEVKDEHKQTEGSPEVKGRIRSLQREIAQRRMMQDVPTADVIVVNPTHFAVALRYDQEKMRAPVVVAKGVDMVAVQIRGVATEHKVPLLSAPVLARALYYSTEISQPIPEGLYLAVAQVLAYVYQLRDERRLRADQPLEMTDLPIPDDLKRDS